MSKQDDKMRIRNRLIDQAISEAANNQWEAAIELNRKAIELAEDPETYNRLGKALQEVNRYSEALETYQKTLKLAPSNIIARRNIDKLTPLLSSEGKTNQRSRELVDLRLFVSETGKTGITTLTNLANPGLVSQLGSGESVELRHEGRLLNVYTSDGILIGRIEPKLAQRLAELIDGGNKYAAAIAHIENGQVRIVIRETFQHPSQRTKISFPGKLSGDMGSFRPYVRDYSLRYDFDGDDDDEVDEMGEEEEEDLDEMSLDDVDNDDGDDDDELGS
ncbi:tetratricopeptide repeat protein [Herpetosiphon geysericola]|nr:tetratricopeptide repeat protein [Herpetosiphon geysericola]